MKNVVAGFSSLLLFKKTIANNKFPSKPIKFIVPTSTGGAIDGVGRIIAEKMSVDLGVPIIIENIPGAGTLMGVRSMLKSPADGYSILVCANTTTTIPIVNKNSGYLFEDIAGISMLSRMPMILVSRADNKLKNLDDIVKYAKENPNTLTYASLSIGTTSHIPMGLLEKDAGIKLQMVPYKAIPQSVPDVVAGRVDFMFGSIPSVGPLLKDGKLKAYAVTSGERSSYLPDIPTFRELGFKGVNYDLYISLMANSLVPKDILEKISKYAEIAKTDHTVVKKLQAIGQENANKSNIAEFREFLIEEHSLMKNIL